MKRTKTAIRNEIFFDLIAEFGYIKPSMAFEALKNTDAPVSKKTIAPFVASNRHYCKIICINEVVLICILFVVNAKKPFLK